MQSSPGSTHYRVLSPAKINLNLHIYPPLSNGYHPIQSQFHTINLYDVLNIALTPQKQFTLTTTHPTLETDTSNLLYKVYQALETQLPFGLTIHLEKNIPLGGGLGGGSSNAGTLLKFLKTQIPTLPTKKLAHELGSDIPFFLTGGHALVSNTGETVTPLPPQQLHVILMTPNHPLETQTIYHQFDAKTPSNRNRQTTEDFLKTAKIGENDFKALIWGNHPEYAVLETQIAPLYLSGSGASVFTITNTEKDAYIIAQELQQKFPSYWIYPTKTL